jgi:hypothetical protein
MCFSLYFHAKTGDEDSHWTKRALSVVLVQVPDLCFDFMGLVREGGRVGDPKRMGKCRFHKHGEEAECGF